ncbi:ectomycorrhizas-regulated small secreted protein [Ephemerocybe angulata]|uniref:Ectomycorrhizas-regulated small secreted protein n=1 Tax=Ephemerocybe angulata TaxID=980116 RepID=A0A8H6M467_9AGAR|nr:ectomycorrhizas-regulated small secreted protein [Tulosesus angulatus]
MRVSLPTLLSVAISLVSIVNAHQDHAFEARAYVDELTAREEAYNALERRELFSDISTRELIDEVSDRLERRYANWMCSWCHVGFINKGDAKKVQCSNGNSKKGEHNLKHM